MIRNQKLIENKIERKTIKIWLIRKDENLNLENNENIKIKYYNSKK